jgi:hypothetical protein
VALAAQRLRRKVGDPIVDASTPFLPTRRTTMDQLKEAGREIETETKKGMRELDGHDLGDDIGNAGDEIKKDLGNLGDDLRREGREAGRELDQDLHDTHDAPR